MKHRIAELEKERREAISKSEAGAGDSPYLVTGKLEKFFIEGLAGATHKLTDNGRISYLLRSEILDLSTYEGNPCGIKGKIISVPGVKVQIIEVTSASVIRGNGA